MAETQETQLLVLGGGPGGYAAAFLAADRGMKVTLVDAAARLGGTCLLVGCIPSKILLHAADILTGAEEAASWGLKFGRPEIDLAMLARQEGQDRRRSLRTSERAGKRRQVTVVTGRGSLVDGQTLQVEGGPSIRFKDCILATGSVPTRLPGFDTANPRILDSSSALKLDDVPGLAADRRRRLHRPGAGHRLRRPRHKGHGRRADRRPSARRRRRPGAAPCDPAADPLREDPPQYQGGQGQRTGQGHQGEPGVRGQESRSRLYSTRCWSPSAGAQLRQSGAGQGRRRRR